MLYSNESRNADKKNSNDTHTHKNQLRRNRYEKAKSIDRMVLIMSPNHALLKEIQYQSSSGELTGASTSKQPLRIAYITTEQIHCWHTC